MHPVDPADMVQLAPEGNRGLAAIDDAPVGCLCVLPWSIYSGILIDNIGAVPMGVYLILQVSCYTL